MWQGQKMVIINMTQTSGAAQTLLQYNVTLKETILVCGNRRNLIVLRFVDAEDICCVFL